MVNQNTFLRKHKIFVEGKADQVFIRDILKLFYNITLSEAELAAKIINTKGKDNLPNLVNFFVETTNGKRQDGKNLVIFDADYYNIDGGTEVRVAWLENLKAELNIDFEYFLFTDETDQEGTIESLLETCIHPNHRGIFDCWGRFEGCVSGVSPLYTIPAKKSKIYLYLECLHGASKKEKDKIKDPNRNFLEEGIWHFDIENNVLLNKLKLFLDQNLS